MVQIGDLPAATNPSAAPARDGRRLLAVLHADIVGYTKLIAADDEGTVRRLGLIRTKLLRPSLAAFNGRIVGTAGDSVLAVFDSVDAAVRCAVQVQEGMARHEPDLRADQRVRFRIGINIGDALPEEGDLHGEAVVIAVRLETACPPGGICVSRAVFENLGPRLGLRWEPIGSPLLKNIDRPIEAFVLRNGPPDPVTVPAQPRFPEFGGRPAIAVLPFSYADAQDEPIAQTLADDLIAALSAWRTFPVIARASSFTFRRREMDVRAIGRELGARYVVDGSARRHRATLRIAVDLADATTGETLFADRMALDIDQVAAAPDIIIPKLAAELAPELHRVERERVHRLSPEQADAYLLYVQGDWFHQRYTQEDLERAEHYYRAALDKDPEFARAAANLSLSRNFVGLNRWVPDPTVAFAEALDHARRAVAADPRYGQAHFALGVAWMNLQNLRAAMSSLETALKLNPSHASGHAALGQVFNYLDRPSEALPQLNLALRLNPLGNSRFVWLPYMAASHYLLDNHEACLDSCREALALKPDYPNALRYMVAALGQLGREDEARPLLPALARIDGDAAATAAMLRRYYVPAANARIMEGMRRAGYA